MSNLTFPTFAGLSWPVGKQPQWSTRIQKAVSGKEVRAANMAYPLYNFTLVFEYLSLADVQNMLAFVMSVKGAWDNWLFVDQSDNTVLPTQIGIGNGGNTTFQLGRLNGTTWEQIQNPTGTPVIMANGLIVSSSTYTISPTGQVVFNTPPASGVVISWSGNFAYRCRFDVDTTDLSQFMNQMFELKTLKFIGSPVNKV